MARSAKAASAKPAGAMKPVLLAAGLGLYWFVTQQDGASEADAPMWGYLTLGATRLLADIVGAWLIISGVQLALAIGRVALSYVRSLWVQEG